MTERPILFSAPMVRAILDGTKTQTRRPLYVSTKNFASATMDRRYPPDYGSGEWPNLPPGSAWTLSGWRNAKPCDRLWVRETWFPDPPCDGTWGYTAWAGCREGQIAAVPDQFRRPVHCCYRADWTKEGAGEVRWTPAIHMPRWASRISLEITSVRVERLQEISDEDLDCEGLQEVIDAGVDHDGTPRDSWRALWTQINGPESWASNPWVWVVEFKVVKP